MLKDVIPRMTLGLFLISEFFAVLQMDKLFVNYQFTHSQFMSILGIYRFHKGDV